MPSITLPAGPQGPLIAVHFGFSVPRRQALEKLGLPVPALEMGTLLVDTGASHTCLDKAIIKKLNLAATGQVTMQTPSTNGQPVRCLQYDVALYIVGAHSGQLLHHIPAMPVIEADMQSQGLDGLLGRDVLSQGNMFYNGPVGHYTLSF